MGWLDVDGIGRVCCAELSRSSVRRHSVPYHLLAYSQPEQLTVDRVARGMCRPGDPPWPLFSLQPSLNRMEYFRGLGKVSTDWRANSQPRYFVWELEYAVRYVLGGAQKASLAPPFAQERPNTVSASLHRSSLFTDYDS